MEFKKANQVRITVIFVIFIIFKDQVLDSVRLMLSFEDVIHLGLELELSLVYHAVIVFERSSCCLLKESIKVVLPIAIMFQLANQLLTKYYFPPSIL